MASPFFKVRDPDRWTQIETEFPHGAHWLHVVEHMFAIVLLNVKDACLDLDIRYVPKLELTGRQKAVSRSLSVRHRNFTCKRIAVKFDNTGCLIGDNYVCLDSEGAVTRLGEECVFDVSDLLHSVKTDIDRGNVAVLLEEAANEKSLSRTPLPLNQSGVMERAFVATEIFYKAQNALVRRVHLVTALFSRTIMAPGCEQE